MRIKDAGDSALLLELDAVIDPAVNARAVGVAAAVRAEGMRGVRDVISMYRSVAVYFDPLVADIAHIRAVLTRAAGATYAIAEGRHIDVPVAYGGEFGPDLDEVAAFAGVTPQRVIELHASAEYRVFMLGFLPGFAYMGTVPREIAAPRRAIPRVWVPGGSVGIAGAQTAVYPRDSPGGWQIVGRTAIQLFDAEKSPAGLFAPGDSVRFVPTRAVDVASGFSRADVASGFSRADVASGFSRTNEVRLKPDTTGRRITVLRPGLFTTIQDSGRWGHQASGVPVSGAMDLAAHRTANALVGNRPDAATLEATLVGPELRFESEATVAVSGADLRATLDGAAVALNVPARGRAGAVLRFGERRAGTRACIAFDGGIATAPVLGSRATHTVSAMGGLDGRALVAGDHLPLGGSIQHAPARSRQSSPVAAGGARVRVMRGPQDSFFPDAAFEILQRSRFTVSPQSNRMGYRLQGSRIPLVDGREMISDATFTGAIQVPASGDPILLMADRQTTGGYPQIATVITADLPVAAQLAPGDWIEFELCSRADAVAALVAQEGNLRAIG